MNAYQRGNRDGLVSFAQHLDDWAEMYDREYELLNEKIRKVAKPTEFQRVTILLARHRAVSAREAAARARRMSESIPHDPEETRGLNREGDE